MKFGGTSLGNAKRIANVSMIIKEAIYKKPIVVVSAIAKITDSLIALAEEAAKGKGDETLAKIKKVHEEIINELHLPSSLLEKEFEELTILLRKTKHEKELTKKTFDHFQSYGEQLSSKIVSADLNKIGVNAKAFNSWDIGLLTTSEYGNAEPIEESYSLIKKALSLINAVPIITGFIGKTKTGEITTLGRGGSDYSAAIIGNAVNAEEIQIWTDVDGILSADPKIIQKTKTIPEVSFAEASELAYFGAKVLHPKTILPAMQKNIPVRVLNSFSPEKKGTLILKNPRNKTFKIKAIAVKKAITLIDIESTRMLGAYGFLSRIFSIFNNYKKSVDVLATSEVSVSLTIDNQAHLEKIQIELGKIGRVNIYPEQAIICIVGEGMREALEVPGKTFTLLAKNKIRIDLISQGASQVNITFLVEEKDVEKSLQLLHWLFIEKGK